MYPFSKINVSQESPLCVDIGKSLVPKFPIKNRASTLFRVLKRIKSHLFVPWSSSESKMYLVRISVVHQLKSVTIILCLLGFFMYILVVLWPGFNLIADLGIIVKAFAHHLQAGWSWTKFYIGRVWYWICGRAVPVLIRRKLKSGTYIRKQHCQVPYERTWRPKDQFFIGHFAATSFWYLRIMNFLGLFFSPKMVP